MKACVLVGVAPEAERTVADAMGGRQGVDRPDLKDLTVSAAALTTGQPDRGSRTRDLQEVPTRNHTIVGIAASHPGTTRNSYYLNVLIAVPICHNV
jgi:hypothetical protein